MILRLRNLILLAVLALCTITLPRAIAAEAAYGQADDATKATPAQTSSSTAAPLVSWPEHTPRRAAYGDDLINAMRLIPIQDGGRIKPFDTYISFMLYRLHGMRSVRMREPIEGNTKLTPMEWALDVLLYPEQADTYRLFRIESDAILDMIKIALDEAGRTERKHSGLFFIEYPILAQSTELIDSLAAEANRKESKDRSTEEQALISLAENLFTYEQLRGIGYAARASINLSTFGGPAQTGLSGAVTWIRGQLRAGQLNHEIGLFREIGAITSGARLGRLLPHSDDGEATWITIDELTARTLGGSIRPDDPKWFLWSAYETLLKAETDARNEAAMIVLGTAGKMAEERGEGAMIASEVAFYRADLFYKALIMSILFWAVMSLFMAAPNKRPWMSMLATLTALVPFLLVAAGIAWRCWLRGRPPTSTLYESILLVTAGMQFFCIIAEVATRRMVAAWMSLILGAAGLFLARKYEVTDGSDTMPTLIAVLDTNYWLAVHVTTIVLGYAAGLMAGFIAHLYLLAKAVDAVANMFRGGVQPVVAKTEEDKEHNRRLGRNDDGTRKGVFDPDLYRLLGRLVYGVTAGAMVLTVVGTILGGIWANDSWGRFWGWDPKENGALLICLSQIIMIHSRVGGFVKMPGFCVLAVLTNIVIAFSWWHVNLLGVGLHSYGFTGGVMGALVTFYVFQLIVVLIGLAAIGITKNQLAQDKALLK